MTRKVSMDWCILVVLQVIFPPALSVFFTVETEQAVYKSEFGGDVVMGCSFHPKPSNLTADLKVTWHWRTSTGVWEVYQMINGVEQSSSQTHRGRVRLLTEELKDGWAKLQVSRLRINDSGVYQCLVQTGEGADYKTITLSVTAPYKAVTKHIEKSGGDEVLLTCQSEGYPESKLIWQDGHLRRIEPNTTTVSTPDQLVKITSQIHISSKDENNYTCQFMDNGPSATFYVPDEIPDPQVKNDALFIVLCVGVVMAVMIVAVVMYRRRKGFPGTRKSLLEGQGNNFTAVNCQQINEENKDARVIFNEDRMEENLGVFLKTHYSDVSTEVKKQWGVFNVDESLYRLQNNEGQALKLQDLLPEAGETLFLEGPPGSGKTTIAHILLSSWTESTTRALMNPVDLSHLQLLLYIDFNKVKNELLQEIVTQLSSENAPTQHELRTMLIRSSKALLLLDGYREGNQVFDESLKRFLSERGGCRVLVTACPGDCPMLKEAVGAKRALMLQT